MPVPLAPLVIASQSTLFVAVHEQPPVTFRNTAPVLAVAGKFVEFPGANEYRQLAMIALGTLAATLQLVLVTVNWTLFEPAEE